MSPKEAEAFWLMGMAYLVYGWAWWAWCTSKLWVGWMRGEDKGGAMAALRAVHIVWIWPLDFVGVVVRALLDRREKK